MADLLKVIGELQKILELASAFDATFERTKDGKLKICIIVDPKVILNKKSTENNENKI